MKKEKLFNWRNAQILVRDIKSNEVKVFKDVEAAASYVGYTVFYIETLIKKGKLLRNQYEFKIKNKSEDDLSIVLLDLKECVSKLEAMIK